MKGLEIIHFAAAHSSLMIKIRIRKNILLKEKLVKKERKTGYDPRRKGSNKIRCSPWEDILQQSARETDLHDLLSMLTEKESCLTGFGEAACKASLDSNHKIGNAVRQCPF